MSVANVLIPAKFFLMMLHLLTSITILYTRQDNIYASLPSDAMYGSTDYNNAQSSLIGAATLTIIFLVIQLAILLIGITTHFDRLNLSMSVFHGLGTIAYGWFVLGNWKFITLWYIWIVFSLIPFVCDSVCAFLGWVYYRKLKGLQNHNHNIR